MNEKPKSKAEEVRCILLDGWDYVEKGIKDWGSKACELWERLHDTVTRGQIQNIRFLPQKGAALVAYIRDNKIETVLCVTSREWAQIRFVHEIGKLDLIGKDKRFPTAAEVIKMVEDEVASSLTVKVNPELNLQLVYQ